jgi:amino acid adenylation domain-containing protein
MGGLVKASHMPRECEQQVADDVTSRISEQAMLTPSAIAVAMGDTRLTYAELERRANQLAHALRRLGVEPEAVVGLCLDRSVDALVAMLATLKAGAAFLPLEPDLPSDRLAFMAADVEARVIVAQHRGQLTWLQTAMRTLVLDEEAETIAREADSACAGGQDGRNLAYILYTSGSTGEPKAVQVSHDALAHFAGNMAETLGLRPDDRVLQFASFGFDVAVEEIFPAWTRGACVVVSPPAVWSDLGELQGVLTRERITVMELPTAYWLTWVQAIVGGVAPKAVAPLRLVLVGGERMAPEWVHHWRTLGIPLVHVFGITEVTVTSTVSWTAQDPDWTGEVPIGRPLPGVHVYVLDALQRLVPDGVDGELYIGGAGVARGYAGRPGWTATRFVPDPFGTPAGRLYRTGDVVRRRPDGELEFVGRMDTQVKVRGYRIELEEVETVLARHPGVAHAAVVTQEAADGQQLVAFFVPAGSTTSAVSPDTLRAYIRETLPGYMMPNHFVPLDSLPVSTRGKIDRRALAARALPVHAGRPSSVPETEIERILTEIWTRVLRIPAVLPSDNFFELGGDSLLSIQIVTGAQQAGLQLSVWQLFQYQTVRELAAAVQAEPLKECP